MPGLDHGVQTPDVHVLLPCLFEPLEACGRRMHRPDLCLPDEWRRRGGTDPRRKPAEVGRAPSGPAPITAILSQHKGVQTARGVLASADDLFTRPGAIAHGCIVDGGDIDGGEIPGAGQAGAWPRVPAVGCDPSARFWGDQRRGHHPAIVAWLGEIPRTPGATGAGFVDEEEGCGVRWHLADQWIDVTWTCADGPQVHDLGAVILSHLSHSDGVLVNSHSDAECARVRHG